MDATKIEFRYSPKGVPYIDLGVGQLSFSKITADRDKGYKYIVYNHRFTDIVVVKKKRDGKSVRETFEAEVHDSHVFNMWFYKDEAQKFGIPRDSIISARLGNWLRNVFSNLITNDGYMPFKKIPELEHIINEADLKKIQKTVIKRKRKPKRKKKK